MSDSRHINGFTLIELVVVISIMAILLYFSVPLFKNLSLVSDTRGQVSTLVGLIQSLKQKAVQEQNDYFLHIDPGTGAVWVTHETMDRETANLARDQKEDSYNDLVIHSVEFPGIPESRSPSIRFSKKGYSDMALIHIRDGEGDITLRIEPFLYRVDQENRYVSYNDCM